MSLLQEAAEFTREILEDVDTGFGRLITVTDPTGAAFELKGFAKDIAQTLDPQTGTLVSGRHVSATLPLPALAEVGLDLPIGEANPNAAPWLVSFADLAGKVSTFKVRETMPDRTLPLIVCILEHWGG